MFFKIGDTVVLPNGRFVAKTATVTRLQPPFVWVEAEGWKHSRSFLAGDLKLAEEVK